MNLAALFLCFCSRWKTGHSVVSSGDLFPFDEKIHQKQECSCRCL